MRSRQAALFIKTLFKQRVMLNLPFHIVGCQWHVSVRLGVSVCEYPIINTPLTSPCRQIREPTRPWNSVSPEHNKAVTRRPASLRLQGRPSGLASICDWSVQ